MLDVRELDLPFYRPDSNAVPENAARVLDDLLSALGAGERTSAPGGCAYVAFAAAA
jgi:hypothetical protein